MSQRQFQLELNEWFSPKVEYEGWGIAEFSKPEGRIEGETRVLYDEFEEPHIRMEVKGLPKDKNNNSVVSDLIAFYNGMTDKTYLKSMMTIPGERINPCTSLTVETLDGFFSALDIGLGYEYLAGSPVSFHPMNATYKLKENREAKYFILPLANFLNTSTLCYRPKSDQHPLLMYRMPSLPSDLDEAEQEYVDLLKSYSMKPFIPFTYNETLAFIEFVPDYKEREGLLKCGEEGSLITALLVGEIKDQIVGLSNWREFLPLDILPVLSMATGRRVGCPWIELRDANCSLVERLHTSVARAKFRSGPPALGVASSNNSVSQLLTKAVQKNIPYAERGYLNAAISQLVLGGYFENDGNVEDKLSHLFRAIDALWRYHKGEAKPSSGLDSKTMKQVEKIINNAREKIERLKSKFQNESIEAKALHKIQQLLIGINKDESPKRFHTKLRWLLSEYDLQDAEILDVYYESSVTGKSGNWLDNVNKHRNAIMHEGWFNWREERPDIDELKALVFHLHDIGVRILLKTLDYSGEYTPSIADLSGISRTLDWVQPNTTAADLGYDLV